MHRTMNEKKISTLPQDVKKLPSPLQASTNNFCTYTLDYSLSGWSILQDKVYD